MEINFMLITFLSIVASANDKPTVAIIKGYCSAKCGTPLATKT